MTATMVEVAAGAGDKAQREAKADASLVRLTLSLVVTGLVAVSIGLIEGPLQALNYAGIDLERYLTPVQSSYYVGLTLHGVLNAYAFTTFFISGLLLYLSSRELDLLPGARASWAGYWIMLTGLLMTIAAILSNSSTVLYTFYTPMQAHWSFYAGLGLLFTGSWVFAWQVYALVRRWRRLHPGRITPLVSWMSLIVMMMWWLASFGVVASIGALLLPWSLGWGAGVDPLVTRTLFWWTGHPIVYFWLMPAYISWYALVPRQAGGRLISDPMARLAFVLLLVFSLPVGTHHQLEDAGIPTLIRGLVILMTFAVILPSLITAFTVGASLENAGRARGGRGWLGWFRALPWQDPSVSAQVLAMLLFIAGGTSGLVNGSWILNSVIHNTTWVTGHFHATLAGATALTFFGIGFWLLPHLSGKPLFAPALARASGWLWFAGMLLLSNAMMAAGLYGVPRRAWLSAMLPGLYEDIYGIASLPLLLIGAGGVLLAVAVVFVLVPLFGTLLQPPRPSHAAIPFAEAVHGPQGSALARICDHYWLWFLGSALLVAAVYAPLLSSLTSIAVPLEGLRRW